MVLDDADEYLMMPLAIPMTAALSQTMTLAQRELSRWGIDKFIVAGAASGATAAWLASLSDERIDAVVAMFPDGVAARQVLKHTYRTYGGRWPLAFHPYYQLGIDRRIETPAFDKLMQIA
ncbi:PhoPQ-activated protein PqaA family protein, partial [Serratia marcescens]|uniref:PhoPQ-activated protein PqaA family protein n=1 Tax=Serratia marcescens TaxID=615 RepID=UPI002B061A8C